MENFNLNSLVRPNILLLKPYRCARDDYTEGILLDANENSFGHSISTQSINIDANLNRYPDPYQKEVKSKILNLRKEMELKEDNLFLGVGSDEVIDLVFRIFCRPGLDKILITPPTYGMYKVSAQINDVEVVTSNLTEDFQLNVEDMLKKIKEQGETLKIIFLCSPGNPTGTCLSQSSILKILQSGYKGIVVVDEAYIDFVSSSDASSLNLLSKFPNLVVMQTLSKAFGLAGIRLGIGYGSKEIIQLMNNTKAPYNISTLTGQLASQALDPSTLNQMYKTLEQIRSQRTYLINQFTHHPSVLRILGTNDANFVLIQIKDSKSNVGCSELAKKIYKELADHFKVVIRYRGDEIHCQGGLRITVGTPQENEELLKAFNQATQSIIN